jgi:hypothetical protein
MNLFKLIILILVFISGALVSQDLAAQSQRYDSIPQECSKFGQDEHLAFVCHLARKFKTPFFQTGAIYTLVTLESAAKTCNFTLKYDCSKIKDKIFSSANTKELYDFITHRFAEATIVDKTFFCQEYYLLFGPLAPPGPYDSLNQLFE